MPATLSIEEVIDRHVAALTWRNLRPNTITQRRRILTRIAKQAAPLELLYLTADEVTMVLSARPLKPVSQRCYLAHLADFYAWCVQTGLRADDPTARIERPKTPRRLPRPIPDADLVRALDLAPNLQIRTVLMFAAYAGLRGCEIAAMRAEHLLLSGGEPVLIIADAKGGDEQTVALGPCLMELVEQLPDEGPLVPRADGKPGHRTSSSVGHLANNYLHSTGTAYTLHSLRHWFGTNLYASSAGDLLVTQKGLRHQWVSTTEGYVEISAAQVSAAILRLPAPAALASAAEARASAA